MSIWIEPNVSFHQCLPDGFNRCLSELVPTVSFTNVCLEGPVDVCLDRTQCFFFCQCLSDGFDLCLSELVPAVSFLPTSVWRNLLMSIRTEPKCFSCQCLSSGINRCLPEVFPNVFCQICLKGSLDVFLD